MGVFIVSAILLLNVVAIASADVFVILIIETTEVSVPWDCIVRGFLRPLMIFNGPSDKHGRESGNQKDADRSDDPCRLLFFRRHLFGFHGGFVSDFCGFFDGFRFDFGFVFFHK